MVKIRIDWHTLDLKDTRVGSSTWDPLWEIWFTCVVLVFPKREIYGLTLRTWHIVLREVNTLRTCKKIVELTVISDGESRKETA